MILFFFCFKLFYLKRIWFIQSISCIPIDLWDRDLSTFFIWQMEFWKDWKIGKCGICDLLSVARMRNKLRKKKKQNELKQHYFFFVLLRNIKQFVLLQSHQIVVELKKLLNFWSVFDSEKKTFEIIVKNKIEFCFLVYSCCKIKENGK